MKNRILLLFAVMVGTFFSACNTNEPEVYTGRIIGTFGCYDMENNFHQGLFIETNKKDVFLSFNLDVADSIVVLYGTYAISPIDLPYSFNVTILNENDERYVHYKLPLEDTMHQPITKPLDEIEQAIIIPCK